MQLDISKVEFSNKDIRNRIKIPTRLTPKLGYLVGIHIGDGCMNIYKRMKIKDYRIEYSGHIIDEKEFHTQIIGPIFKELFNKEVSLQYDKRIGHSNIRTYLRSKGILTFLNKVMGIPLGPKNRIDIPQIIKKSNNEIKKEFIKGLSDTESCLTFKKRHRKKHYYPTISISNQSKKLIKNTEKLLKLFEINSSSSYDILSLRNGKKTTRHDIYIYGKDNLNKWMKLIGFNSTKHLTKYETWKKFGFCPPNTNILQRQKILKGEIDINSFYGAVA